MPVIQKVNRFGNLILSCAIASASLSYAALAAPAAKQVQGGQPLQQLPTAGAPAAGAPAQPAPQTATDAKRIDVNTVKQQYWAHGSGPELNVVQNRIYTKAMKFNIEPFGGVIMNDPFLNTYTVGGMLGFNFTEYLGVHAVFHQVFNANSGAYDALVQYSGYGANSNRISQMLGGEVEWSLLYGKLSLIGKVILHFDLFVLGGAGVLNAANIGNTFVPWIGIGQQLYLTTWMSLRLDYRYMRYQENVVEQHRPGLVGTVYGNRATYAPALTIGLNFLFP